MFNLHSLVRPYYRFSAIASLMLASLTAFAQPEDEPSQAGYTTVNVVAMRTMPSQPAAWIINDQRVMVQENRDSLESEPIPITLPNLWRPGLSMTVRWLETYDGSRPPGMFKATVPIEEYEKPGLIVVVGFDNGWVRAISADFTSLDTLSLEQLMDRRTYGLSPGEMMSSRATQGTPISTMYTHEELQQLSPTTRIPVTVSHIVHDDGVTTRSLHVVDGASFSRDDTTGCCVWLPNLWSSDIHVNLNWFSSGPASDSYFAFAPVDKYQYPENLQVHLFPNNKARVLLEESNVDAIRTAQETGMPPDDLATEGRSIREGISQYRPAKTETTVAPEQSASTP